MLFGVQKTERVLGLHGRPCRSCRPAAERLVSTRRWGCYVLGLPLIALDARWRRCTSCARRGAMPRLSLATVVLASFVLAALVGQDVVAYGDLFLWTLLILFWGVWLAGHVMDAFLDRRLVPVPPALFRPARPVAVKTGAGRRAAKAGGKGPTGRWRSAVRAARVPVRVLRTVHRLRRA